MKTFHIDFRRDIVTDLPSFQFTRDTASLSEDGNFLEQSYFDLDSFADQYKIGQGIMRLQFDLFSYNYFNANVKQGNFAHIFALARFNKADVLSSKTFNGQGLVLGNVSNFRNPVNNSRGNPVFPSVQAKTWASTINDKCITSTSWNGKLEDTVQYRVVFDSIVTQNKTNKVRYRLYKVVGIDTLELLYDTKQVDAGNFDFNSSNSGICFGHVNGNKTADVWKLEFTNVKVIWGPYVTDDTPVSDPCTCPRIVTVYSNKNEIFTFDNTEFQIGFDYSVIESTSNGTPIYGFRDFAPKTEKGYKIQFLNSQYCRLPSFLNLGIKFKDPEDVLVRDLPQNIKQNRGYDSWSVGVKGTVEILHDCLEFENYGKILPLDKIITNKFLNFGTTFTPRNLNGSVAKLDTADFVKFKYVLPQKQDQRTNRKNLYFVFKLSEIVYYLNTGAGAQQKFVVAKDIELTVNIPLDVGQDTCCGDNINKLPAPLPTAIIPTVVNDNLLVHLNYNVGVQKPITWVGGNGKVTATISPDLPNGLTFNKNTAEITGISLTVFPPTEFTITFKDLKNEVATATFKLKVDSGVPS